MATEFQFFPGLDYTLLRREDEATVIFRQLELDTFAST